MHNLHVEVVRYGLDVMWPLGCLRRMHLKSIQIEDCYLRALQENAELNSEDLLLKQELGSGK